VRAHLAGEDDGLVVVRPLLDRIGAFADILAPGSAAEMEALRRAETIGRPLGDEAFLDGLEARLGRRLRPGKRGRPPAIRS